MKEKNLKSKVGPFEFKIRFEFDPQIAPNERCFGYCDSEKNEIIIDRNLSNIQIKYYLMHEIIEQICSIYFLELTHEQKGILGGALFEYIRKNKKIIKYFME